MTYQAPTTYDSPIPGMTPMPVSAYYEPRHGHHAAGAVIGALIGLAVVMLVRLTVRGVRRVFQAGYKGSRRAA